MTDVLKLGPECGACCCATCGYRPDCTTTAGDTQTLCYEDCKGVNGFKQSCYNWQAIERE